MSTNFFDGVLLVNLLVWPHVFFAVCLSPLGLVVETPSKPQTSSYNSPLGGYKRQGLHQELGQK